MRWSSANSHAICERQECEQSREGEFHGIPKTPREIKRATNRIPTIARPRKLKVKA